MRLMKTTAILGAALIGLAACTTPVVHEAKKATEKNYTSAQSMMTRARQPLPPANTDRIQVRDGVFLGAVSSRRTDGQRLPIAVERDGVTLVSSAPLNLYDIGSLITRVTGIPVTFTGDLLGQQSSSGGGGGGSTHVDATDTTGMAEAIKGMSPPSATALSGKSGDKDLQKIASAFGASDSVGRLTSIRTSSNAMKVNYQGPLSKFLNLAAAHYNVGWRFKDGHIRFIGSMTRTFTLAAIPSTSQTSSSLNSGLSSKGNGAEAGASQTSKTTVTLDFWKDVEDAVKNIVGSEGRYTVSRSASTVTVSAPYPVVERVSSYIADTNKKLLRQVTVNVAVYSVTLDKKSMLNFDPQGLFDNGKIAASLGNVASFNPLIPGLIPGSTSIQSGVPGLNAGIVDPNSDFAGSNALIQALDSRGNVSVVTTAAVTTMSGQPVPLQVANTRGYVKEIETSVTDNGTVSTSLSTDTVNTGFSLNVIPQVMDDGRVLLQYGINVSELAGKEDGFDVFAVNGNQVQLPNVNQRSFIQESLMKNRSTLVLAGFEQVQDQANNSGVGHPDFKLLGGGYDGANTRQVLVIAITPTVLDNSPTLASIR